MLMETFAVQDGDQGGVLTDFNLPVEFDLSTVFDLPAEFDVPADFDLPVEFDVAPDLDLPADFDLLPDFQVDLEMEFHVPAEFNSAPDFVLPVDFDMPPDFDVLTDLDLFSGFDLPGDFPLSAAVDFKFLLTDQKSYIAPCEHRAQQGLEQQSVREPEKVISFTDKRIYPSGPRLSFRSGRYWEWLRAFNITSPAIT
jgi:hypothetical protein